MYVLFLFFSHNELLRLCFSYCDIVYCDTSKLLPSETLTFDLKLINACPSGITFTCMFYLSFSVTMNCYVYVLATVILFTVIHPSCCHLRP